MSQINVNTIVPFSGSLVSINSLFVRKTANSVFLNGSNTPITATYATTIGVGTAQNATGASMVAIGTFAGMNLTTGTGNVLVGSAAGQSITTGNANTAIGASALTNVTTGLANTVLGNQAGSTITTGNSNTFIGDGAGNNQLNITGQGNTVIGYGASPSSSSVSYEFTLGNASISVLRCAQTAITSLSDARDKKEVEDLNVGLDFIDGLRPVKFVWDDRDEAGRHDIADFGFIAQDLKAAEEAVEMADILKLVYDENPEKLEASYGKLIPILVKAVQELSAEVKAIKK
jgi:trimeric autotransporter adhesin